MSRHVVALAIGVGLLTAGPSVAAPIAGVTADGTWDCRDSKSATAGVVVLAEKTYAFIKPDGKLGGYGKMFQMGIDQYDLPHFVFVAGGPLTDDVHSQGLFMRGPTTDPHNFNGELFLNVILSADGKDDWDCARRKAP